VLIDKLEIDLTQSQNEIKGLRNKYVLQYHTSALLKPFSLKPFSLNLVYDCGCACVVPFVGFAETPTLARVRTHTPRPLHRAEILLFFTCVYWEGKVLL
jgi:hypothetical protein